MFYISYKCSFLAFIRTAKSSIYRYADARNLLYISAKLIFKPTTYSMLHCRIVVPRTSQSILNQQAVNLLKAWKNY